MSRFFEDVKLIARLSSYVGTLGFVYGPLSQACGAFISSCIARCSGNRAHSAQPNETLSMRKGGRALFQKGLHTFLLVGRAKERMEIAPFKEQAF